MGIIANAHPKGGVGKTTSSVNLVGEMKTDAVDLDTHTGLSIILGLRPDSKQVSVRVPNTVEELIEIMTPYKNSDKDLFIDCGGFDSDLTRTAVAFADCVIVPSKDSLTERIGLMHFDAVLAEISSIMETISQHIFTCAKLTQQENFPKLEALLPTFKHLKLMDSRISARAEFEDVIESGMGITETLHGRTTQGGKEVIALVNEIKQLMANKR
ncbi:putative plasmid partition protein [Salmonella enterica subsp. enterica serovar Gaminara str. ATCC BAA-711]|nr:putative plasmid partition protein [Salmonella enterica subsp. enterica serovar Gaminara str. ATCC BAA-711]